MQYSSKNLAVASLVCGILGIVLYWWIGILGLIPAIVAIVLGVKARRIAMQFGEPSGMATAGFVLGIVGTCLIGLSLVCAACVVGTLFTMGTM